MSPRRVCSSERELALRTFAFIVPYSVQSNTSCEDHFSIKKQQQKVELIQRTVFHRPHAQPRSVNEYIYLVHRGFEPVSASCSTRKRPATWVSSASSIELPSI